MAQLGVAGTQGRHLVLELEDAAYAFDADPGGSQLRDLAEQLDVAQGVAVTAFREARKGADPRAGLFEGGA